MWKPAKYILPLKCPHWLHWDILNASFNLYISIKQHSNGTKGVYCEVYIVELWFSSYFYHDIRKGLENYGISLVLLSTKPTKCFAKKKQKLHKKTELDDSNPWDIFRSFGNIISLSWLPSVGFSFPADTTQTDLCDGVPAAFQQRAESKQVPLYGEALF